MWDPILEAELSIGYAKFHPHHRSLEHQSSRQVKTYYSLKLKQDVRKITQNMEAIRGTHEYT